jgi:hypothetical protein
MTGQTGYCTKEVLVSRVTVVGKLGGLKSRYGDWSEAFHCAHKLGDTTKSILSQFTGHLSAEIRGLQFHIYKSCQYMELRNTNEDVSFCRTTFVQLAANFGNLCFLYGFSFSSTVSPIILMYSKEAPA